MAGRDRTYFTALLQRASPSGLPVSSMVHWASAVTSQRAQQTQSTRSPAIAPLRRGRRRRRCSRRCWLPPSAPALRRTLCEAGCDHAGRAPLRPCPHGRAGLKRHRPCAPNWPACGLRRWQRGMNRCPMGRFAPRAPGGGHAGATPLPVFRSSSGGVALHSPLTGCTHARDLELFTQQGSIASPHQPLD